MASEKNKEKREGSVCSEDVGWILVNTNAFVLDSSFWRSLSIFIDTENILIEVNGRYPKTGKINITGMQQNTLLSSPATKLKVSVSEFRHLCISAGINNAVIMWIKSPKTKLRTCRNTMTKLLLFP